MITTFTYNLLVNSFGIHLFLKPCAASVDNLRNEFINKQYFVDGPGFNTPYWNFLAISDNKIQLLHTFISAIMLWQ